MKIILFLKRKNNYTCGLVIAFGEVCEFDALQIEKREEERLILLTLF